MASKYEYVLACNNTKARSIRTNSCYKVKKGIYYYKGFCIYEDPDWVYHPKDERWIWIDDLSNKNTMIRHTGQSKNKCKESIDKLLLDLYGKESRC